MNKQQALEAIAHERQEQITKHGYTLENDKKYTRGQLVKVANFCKSPRQFHYPRGWSHSFRLKLLDKTLQERYIIGGAFLMAENDRIGKNVYQKGIEWFAQEIENLK